jgi:hypothetical protein
MSDRILRGSIIRSNKVNSLTWAGEVFYRRLMSVADDFGCFDANPAIVRTSIYPKQLNKVSESDVAKWTQQIAEAGLIRLYEHDNDLFLEILEFDQRLRQKRRRYPEPPTDKSKPADIPPTNGGQPADTIPPTGPPVFESDIESDDEDEPPTPPPKIEYNNPKDIDLLKDLVFSDRGYFREPLQMKYGLTEDQVYQWLIQFNKTLRFSGQGVKTEKDYRTHFMNWLEKQPDKRTPGERKNGTTDSAVQDRIKSLLQKEKNGNS